MFRNNLKIAWRNILRNRISSLINIAGLSIGMGAVILIILYVQDELSFDKSFKDADRIYRVNVNGKMGDEEFFLGYTPPPAGKTLMDNFPEIETYTRIYRPGDQVIRAENHAGSFTEKGILAVDSNFLQVLDYPLIRGNPAKCLLDPHSILITEAIARKYFGDNDPLNKFLSLGDEKIPYKVTGVLKDMSALPASLKFDILVPVSNFGDVSYFNWSWVWLGVATYIKLHEPLTDVTKLEAKLPEMIRTHAASAFERIGQPYDEFLKKGGRWDLHIQPLLDIHLHSGNITSVVTNQSDIQYVYIFSAIAIFIVLLACVNFMNLSTAQSARRAREVGIRKLLGSVRTQLIRQFLLEAILFSLIAVIVALVLVKIALPSFNELAGKQLSYASILNDKIWITILATALFSGLFAGSYPAFYLTSFKPVKVLNGLGFLRSNSGNRLLRSGLVVFQFTVSTALIICTIIVYNQLHYSQTKDLGFDKDNIIVISNTNRLGASEKSFSEEILEIPGVVSSSISTSLPAKRAFGDFYVPVAGNADLPIAKDISLSSYMTDERFVPTMGMEILAGRNFEKGFADSGSVLINETAMKQIGWKDAISQYLRYPGGDNESYKVVGIIKDFKTESFHSLVTPFALFHKSSKVYEIDNSFITVKVKPGDLTGIVASLETKWKSFTADTPLDYNFLDSDIEALYRAEQRMGNVFGIFTALAIFVACIGLFGLVSFTAEQRTKEIGIRKVLGASVASIIQLLSRDFMRLIVLSIVLATPIAWWIMSKWLEDFAYRVDIHWWTFALAAILAVMIALATLSLQSIRAAVSNPVKSLRAE